jgi:hypothetical protein
MSEQPPKPTSHYAHYSRVASFDPRQMKRAVSEVEGFNAKLAVIITSGVGTMACAYAFAALALISAPAKFSEGTKGAIEWIAQTFLQLVLLSIILVGQRVQSAASDSRAAKEFHDTEIILDRLDTKTAGGIADVIEAVKELEKTVVAPK